MTRRKPRHNSQRVGFGFRRAPAAFGDQPALMRVIDQICPSKSKCRFSSLKRNKRRWGVRDAHDRFIQIGCRSRGGNGLTPGVSCPAALAFASVGRLMGKNGKELESLVRNKNEKNAEEKRTDILRAALACFSSKGLQNTSIKDICNRSKMRSGHIYYYFSSKAHIIEEIYNLGAENMLSRIRSMLNEADIVSAMYENYYTSEKNRREWHITPALRLELIAETAHNERFSAIYRESERRILEEIESAVATAVDERRLVSRLSVADLAKSLLLFWSAFAILGLSEETPPESFRDTIRRLLVVE